MADQNPTRAIPAVGKTLSVKVTADLHDDLAIIVTRGVNVSDAVRAAVALAADAYRSAWEYGDVPDGIAPRLIALYRPPNDA